MGKSPSDDLLGKELSKLFDNSEHFEGAPSNTQIYRMQQYVSVEEMLKRLKELEKKPKPDKAEQPAPVVEASSMHSDDIDFGKDNSANGDPTPPRTPGMGKRPSLRHPAGKQSVNLTTNIHGKPLCSIMYRA